MFLFLQVLHFASIIISVLSLVALVEESYRAGTGVASDNRSDVKYLNRFYVLELFFDESLDKLCVIEAVGVGDIASARVIFSVLCKKRHFFNDSLDDSLLCSQDCFGYLGFFFVALYKFQDCFFCFCEKCHWTCDRDGIDSIEGLG